MANLKKNKISVKFRHFFFVEFEIFNSCQTTDGPITPEQIDRPKIAIFFCPLQPGDDMPEIDTRGAF